MLRIASIGAALRRNIKSTLPRAAALVVVFLFYSLSPITCSLLRAQTETATLSGIIQDPKGGAVPGVEVTLTRIETGTVGTTTTNGAGIYVFTGLEPGHFRLLVRKEGFKEISIKEFELHVQDKLEQNFSLEIGSISERVTVEGGGLNINTTDATVSTTIDRNFAENLPLNGRSFQTLILLTPGTVLNTTAAPGQFSVNGQRANANNFSVDGVNSNFGGLLTISSASELNGSTPGFTALGTTQGMVAVDALQEFKIQTSTYSPEFGRQPGGQVSLLTRSGTNALHGTAFDYLRNDVFDANNWFNDATIDPSTGKTIPKGKERQNDFGGTLGGPLLRNRTFFFFSYEGLRLLQPVTFGNTVPSIRLRQEAAPAYQSILNSWPVPSGPESTVPCSPSTDPNCPPSGQEPTGSAPYTFSQSQPKNLDSYSIKIDNTFGKRVHLFGRYSDISSFDSSFAQSNEIDYLRLRQRVLTVGSDVSVTPRLSNETRLNYSTSRSTFTIDPYRTGGAQSFDEGKLLFPLPLRATSDNVALLMFLPQSQFILGLGNQGTFVQRQINVVDNVSYSVGSHQTKWGVDYRRLFPIFAGAPLDATYLLFSENDLATGNVAFLNSDARLVDHPIFTNFSAYIQDSWRASNRLTLTYGLRWDLNLPPGERDGVYPPNVIGVNSPASAVLVPNSPPFETTYDNFAPRIGLAYQLRQRRGHETVVRSGFGVFYDLNTETFADGFRGRKFGNSSDTFSNVPFPVADNFLPIPPLPVPVTLPYRGTIQAIDHHLQLPYTLQWNFALEQGLGTSQSISVSYVASAGLRLLRSDSLFNFSPSFPQGVHTLRNASNSNYQSLQIQFNRQLSQGLQALASYTYSHSIDNASNAETALSSLANQPNFLNPNIDRGSSDFDLRHAFRGAVTYNIPAWNANSLVKAVSGGWSVEAIGLAQSGTPADLAGGLYFPPGAPNGMTLRPNVVPGVPLYLYGSQYPGGKVFNNIIVPGACPGGSDQVGAFCAVTADANGIPTQIQGSLGRNALRGFGAWQMDFALHRQFNFTERVNLQFRSEFFNVFNHPNFSCVSNFVPASGFFGIAHCTLNQGLGGLNQLYQIGGPRSIQLALKLAF